MREFDIRSVVLFAFISCLYAGKVHIRHTARPLVVYALIYSGYLASERVAANFVCWKELFNFGTDSCEQRDTIRSIRYWVYVVAQPINFYVLYRVLVNDTCFWRGQWSKPLGINFEKERMKAQRADESQSGSHNINANSKSSMPNNLGSHISKELTHLSSRNSDLDNKYVFCCCAFLIGFFCFS
jgi:hypothetical protein